MIDSQAHLAARVDRLAECVRVQRQALQRIAELATEPAVVKLATDALRTARW